MSKFFFHSLEGKVKKIWRLSCLKRLLGHSREVFTPNGVGSMNDTGQQAWSLDGKLWLVECNWKWAASMVWDR